MMDFFHIKILTVGCFLAALFLSLLLQFFLYFCIGISGLWVSEIARVFPAVNIILTVISGGIFPMDILGEGFNRVLMFLPFKYLLQFPVDIITGKAMDYSVFIPLGIQLGWVIILGVLAQVLWKRGLKKYITVGG